MTRHKTKTRIAQRMAKRRARILKKDAGLRYIRTMPYIAAMSKASSEANSVRACSAETDEGKKMKAARMIEMSAAIIKIASDAAKAYGTPTEVMGTL